MHQLTPGKAALLFISLTVIGIALLFFIYMRTIRIHENDGGVIDIAGSQRMLTQRYVKEVQYVKHKVFNKSLLANTEKRIVENFETLISNLRLDDTTGKLNGIKKDNYQILNRILLSRQQFNELVILADSFISPGSEPENLQQLYSIIEKNTQLQETLNEMVNLYVNGYDSKIRSYNFWIILLMILLFSFGLIIIYLIFKVQKKKNLLINEIHEREHFQERQNSLLKKIEKINEQLSQFAYVTSHDLKSPLASLSTLANIIESEVKNQNYSELQEYVGMVKGRVSYMENLIKEILEYSKTEKESRKLEVFNIQELIKELVSNISPEKECKIFYHGEFPDLYSSKVFFQQIFSNLISNAMKYNDKEVVEIKISTWQEGDYTIFSIADNGPGIPPEKQSHIFNLYQKVGTGKDSSGTGVGLYVVKKIVEENKGKVWVESDGKSGSTFYFSWPL